MRRVVAGLTAAAMMAGAPGPAVVGGLGVVAGLALATPAAAQSWSLTTQTADGFAIELPGTPSVKRYDQEVGGGATVPVAEFVVPVHGGELMVGASKFGIDPTAEQLAGGYANALDSAMKADGGTQTWRRARTVSGYAGMEMEYAYTVDGAAWKTRVLLVFAKQRFFTVSARLPATAPAATGERLMNGFRIL